MDKIEYFPEGGSMDLSYFPYYGRLAQVSENQDVLFKSKVNSPVDPYNKGIDSPPVCGEHILHISI